MPEKHHAFVQPDLQNVFWIKSWSMDSSSSSHKRQEIEAIGEGVPMLVQFTFVSTFPATTVQQKTSTQWRNQSYPNRRTRRGTCYGPKPGFLKKSVFVPNYLHL
eukprot:TRINITY_DN91380_c0_g1_i1.p1 TRINITY_DN91380_c0_g1~~TRINITY_DN91380_c0_g1_i1.p1  ORF type:complete len:104 (+),score=9.22 TRINITY_DN91380_c0_g1_i1:140-451(+)